MVTHIFSNSKIIKPIIVSIKNNNYYHLLSTCPFNYRIRTYPIYSSNYNHINLLHYSYSITKNINTNQNVKNNQNINHINPKQ